VDETLLWLKGLRGRLRCGGLCKSGEVRGLGRGLLCLLAWLGCLGWRAVNQEQQGTICVFALCFRYERHHRVEMLDDALEAAAR
jgi:hypothetical protein